MKKIIFICLLIAGIVNYSCAQKEDRQASINSIFNKMEQQGIDTSKPLLYGYFFFDKDKSKLESIKNDFLKDNYKLVRLESTGKKSFILHVEKVEIHSRTSLLEREEQFKKLATKHKVASYDGWDVGNIDPSKPLISKDDFENSLEGKSDSELYMIASELYKNDINDKAIIAFEKCIQRNIKLDTCYFKLGNTLLITGQLNNGIINIEQAVNLNPSYFKALFNLGAACYDNQQYQKSIEYYTKAANINPKDDRVYYGLAASQFVSGLHKEAEINCKKALQLNPRNVEAMALLQRLRR